MESIWNIPGSVKYWASKLNGSRGRASDTNFTCFFQVFENFAFTACPGTSQAADFLDAGRGKVSYTTEVRLTTYNNI